MPNHTACATTFIGFEQIVVQEIKEILGVKAVAKKGVVLFSATDKKLAQFCYQGQGVKRVLRLYGTFSFTDIKDWKTKVKETVKNVTDFDKPFRADCYRFGTHNFTSSDVAAAYGEAILEVSPKAKVSLTDPDLFAATIIVDMDSYVGMDFAGFDLSKREYKIYSHPATLNAAFAYCAVRFAGFTGKENLVDPMCGIGTIPLEAVLLATKMSPRFYQKDAFAFHHFMDIDLSQFDTDVKKIKCKIVGYDQHLRHIESARKMAKLVEIHKMVSFSRADLEWLDTKEDEKSVDLVVTQPPVSGRALLEKDMEKLYKEFFYQVSFVLAKKGKVVLLCIKTTVLKKMLDKFTIVDEHSAWQGKREFTLLTLEKS